MRSSRSSGISEPLGVDVGARAAQGIGLRLAAPFGHRFGEIGEQHREPEPDGDLPGKPGIAGVAQEIAQAE